MSLTRKSFVAIAAGIKGRIDKLPGDAENFQFFKEFAEELAVIFAAQNPRFDRNRFLTACGVKFDD